jgi:Flp pilus assembly protein TadG
MQVVPLEPSRRCSGDSGTAIVEAAFISPLLFYLLFATIEMGLYFRAYLAVGATTVDGARTAAVLGTQADTDYQVLQAVKKATSVLPRSNINKLVVFNATAAGTAQGVTPATASVPLNCSSMGSAGVSVADKCNVYTPTANWGVNPPSTSYNCVPYTGLVGLSSGYCPTTRKTALSGTNGPPDYVGIYIELDHKYLTGLFGTTKKVTNTFIVRLEPQSLL